MPQIKPTSVQDLLKFIQDHRPDIENGTYDVLIEDDWVPQIPQDTMGFLAKYCLASRLVISSVTGNKDILLILAKDSDPIVRYNVACNSSSSLEILENLMKISVGKERVFRKRADFPLVGRYYFFEDYTVKTRMAIHNNATSDLLTMLGKDESPAVRLFAAMNPKMPKEILISLANDKGKVTVLENARPVSNVTIPVYIGVANNISTPPEVLEILAKDSDWHVRYCVAENPATKPEVLSILARDSHEIRCAVARNPSTSRNTITTLKKDPSEYVRKNAGKGCFIATAVYGSEFEPEVELLRNYRDRVLTNYKLGRLFISTYYVISPTVADFIKPKRWIRNSVRCFILDPVVWIIRISCFR